MNCIQCGRPLSVYDVGFYKKMVCRGAQEFACIGCTAAHFRLTQEQAWDYIRRFQENGCSLFPPLGEE